MDPAASDSATRGRMKSFCSGPEFSEGGRYSHLGLVGVAGEPQVRIDLTFYPWNALRHDTNSSPEAKHLLCVIS